MSSKVCAICSGKTIGISVVNRLTNNSGFSWENDSTLQLLGWEHADVQLRTCLDCMHTALWPHFDASQLYGERGGQVRKAVLASYGEPSIVPAKGTASLNIEKNFRAAANDLRRFQRVSEFIADNVHGSFDGVDEIRILDWGGGDGYVSAVYARTLEAVTMVSASSFVYDYTEWASVGGTSVGLKELQRMGKFHVLILSGILEHTHDPVGTLKAATEYLLPGGVVICEVPDERYVQVHGILLKKFGLHYHVCYFNERSLHRAMRLSGLTAISTRLDSSSSYRGKPIRFFLGVGCKAGGSKKPSREPDRLSELFKLFVYAVAGFVRSIGNRFRMALRER